MSRFKTTFSRLAKAGRKAVMPFFILGDPSPETSEEAIKAAIDSGADALELGIYFSEPIADGTTVQEAGLRAAKAGMNTQNSLELVSRIRNYAPGTPIGLLIYYNLAYRLGVGEFCAQAKAAGVDAILAADVPLEEIAELKQACKGNGLDTVMIVAPTTTPKRLEGIIAKATGFIYLVSVLGVTGARKDVSPRTIQLIRDVKAKAKIPVLVGFGISTPEQARQVCDAGADGAIVGSAVIRRIAQNLGDESAITQSVGSFVKELRLAVDA